MVGPRFFLLSMEFGSPPVVKCLAWTYPWGTYPQVSHGSHWTQWSRMQSGFWPLETPRSYEELQYLNIGITPPRYLCWDSIGPILRMMRYMIMFLSCHIFNAKVFHVLAKPCWGKSKTQERKTYCGRSACNHQHAKQNRGPLFIFRAVVLCETQQMKTCYPNELTLEH